MVKITNTTTSNKYRKFEVVEFTSMEEFYKYLCDTPFNEAFRWERHSSVENNARFTGTSSFDEAVSLMKNGWADMSKKLTERLKVEEKIEPFKKDKVVYDIVGFAPSVPRYLNGLPTNMLNKQKFPARQKVITLNKSLNYSSSTDVSVIEQESIKAFRIVKKLEAQGYRVNLNVVLGTFDGAQAFAVKVRIKSANERLNISKMSFPMVHPSMLRRLMFRFIEVHPTITKSFVDGYGYPVSTEEMQDVLVDTNKGEYVLPAFITQDVEKISGVKDLERFAK